MYKKQNIIQAATRLFAEQGYENTTTVGISNEAGATEPLIYYHFQGKEDLFRQIIENSFAEYFSRLDALKSDTPTQFERIEALLDLHYRLVEEMPDQSYLLAATCPAKLNYPDHICTKNIHLQRKKLEAYLSDCLKKGIKSGEFYKVPVPGTVNLLIGMINGLFRQRGFRLDQINDMRKVTVDFCRRALVKN